MPQFQTTPNQRIISIVGKEKCDSENIYAKINKEALIEAMKDLTPTTYKVWIYLASQQANYTFSFSPSAIEKETNIKKSSIQESIRQLINKNYLIQRNDNSNIYDFYEIPREEEITIHINKDDSFHF